MRKFFIIVTVATLLFSTACGNAPMQSEPADENRKTIETEPTERDEDIIITIATQGVGGMFQGLIDQFNQADNGYQIVAVDYFKYYDDSNDTGAGLNPEGFAAADLQLKLDILKGGVVNIVPDVAFEYQGNFDVLCEKGAFADLYPFMDNDPEINRETLDSHILSLHETDGKLCQLPVSYRVQTVIAPCELVGKKENWTFEEMKTCWENAPEEVGFSFNQSRDYVFFAILRNNLGYFIDYESGTCSFDSPLFREMLEFIHTFPMTPPVKNDDYRSEYYLVHDARIYDFDGCHQVLDEAHTIVGYPTEEGSGGFIDTARSRYAICADASPEVQQGAWEFIRMMMGEDRVHEGFPVNLAAFEKAADKACENEGKENIISVQGVPYDYGYLTREECDRLIAYIASIDRRNNSLQQPVEDILSDELFASGYFYDEQSLDDTIAHIQSRVSLFVAEQS